jgi:hypothetical protein
MVRAVTEPDDCQLLQRRAVPIPRRPIAIDQGQLHVRDRAHPGQQVGQLEDEPDLLVPDAGKRIVVQLRHVLPFQQVLAAGRRIEASEDAHERRLARTCRSHDRDELAGLDRQRHAAQRVHHVLDDVLSGQIVPRIDPVLFEAAVC